MKNKHTYIRVIRTLASAVLLMMTMGINISPADANDTVKVGVSHKSDNRH